MKKLVFVILIAFVPVMLTGCQKGENIVEKLAPEPTLEEKYGEETIAMLKEQDAIPEWREHIAYVEEAYSVRERVSPADISAETQKKKYTVKIYHGITHTYGFVESAFSSVELLRYHGDYSIEELRAIIIERMVKPNSPSEKDLHLTLDRIIVASILGYSWKDMEAGVKGEFFFFSKNDRRLIAKGKVQ